MKAGALLLVAIVLAGCADEPPPLVQAEPTFSDAPGRPSAEPPALRWIELSNATILLTPAQKHDVDIMVPQGTLSVAANLTLETGALYGLDVSMGECIWRREVALTGGQHIDVDCGGLLDGPAHVRIGIHAGAITGSARIVALVCAPAPGGAACLLKAPVTQG